MNKINTYRVFYIEDKKLEYKEITDTIENIINNYVVFILTDLKGNDITKNNKQIVRKKWSLEIKKTVDNLINK